MIQDGNIWLDIEEVCALSGDKKETIRRKCKSGELVSVFEKIGKFKNYHIALSSLKPEVQKKYYQQKQGIVVKQEQKYELSSSLTEFSNALEWARKQAEKYLELFSLTEKLSYKETQDFIQKWNTQYPEKKTAYSTLMEAKRKYN